MGHSSAIIDPDLGLNSLGLRLRWSLKGLPSSEGRDP